MMPQVRITLNLDDDALAAAKELASLQHRTLGAVISDLVRRGLSPPPAPHRVRNGVPLLPARPASVLVTSALVRRLGEGCP